MDFALAKDRYVPKTYPDLQGRLTPTGIRVRYVLGIRVRLVPCPVLLLPFYRKRTESERLRKRQN